MKQTDQFSDLEFIHVISLVILKQSFVWYFIILRNMFPVLPPHVDHSLLNITLDDESKQIIKQMLQH